MENANKKQTLFDSLVTNRNLQLAKAVIPYIGNNGSRMLAVYTKAMELKNALNYIPPTNSIDIGGLSASETDKPGGDMMSMFNDIKDFLGEDEAEMIDMLITMMDLMKMDPDSKDDMMGNYMEMFKDMF